MSEFKFIKPAREGLLVRKSSGERLDAAGEKLPMSAWWHRREAEGDVLITNVKTSAEAQKRKAVEEE
ncbi:hypothetical protein STW0522KLE44_42350 [Klebsiella sp. STW0522-44]|nr:hypothetical protein STW0522KLE44_42350 [Klebsiella sp. STW0522-44]